MRKSLRIELTKSQIDQIKKEFFIDLDRMWATGESGALLAQPKPEFGWMVVTLTSHTEANKILEILSTTDA